MKLVSKKNGSTTIFPNLISAIASKIGFTPPTGMSATNVQDAIEEVNTRISKNDFGASVDLTTYDVDNQYSAPSDGYVRLACGGSNTDATLKINNITVCVIYGRSTTEWACSTVPVVKGMNLYGLASSNANVEYYPLQ